MKEGEFGKACSISERGQKCIQGFSYIKKMFGGTAPSWEMNSEVGTTALGWVRGM